MAFYLTLPSNVKGEDNLIGNYITTLNKPLILEGEWEVGLCDITYVNSIPNIPDGSIIKADKVGIPVKNRRYDNVYFHSIDALIRDIESNLEVKIGKDGKIKDSDNSNASFILVEGNDFASLLGIGEKIMELAKPKKFKIRKVEDKDQFLILCDLIHEQHYGEKKIPLIRSVPVEGKYGDVIYKEFNHIRYFPIVSNNISTIHIQLKDKTLNHLPFSFGKTVVTLHFRKKHGYGS